MTWQARALTGPIRLQDAGLRVFSQMEEDGLILAIFAAIGTTNKLFVDIGASDGINSNCANLAVNFGWYGLMIEGNPLNVERGRAWYAKHPDTFLFPPVFAQAMVTRENINEIIRGRGFAGDIDFLSIDIDGIDYWVLEAIEAVNPRVIIAESNPALGDLPVTIPYSPTFVQSNERDPYFGAGAEALRRLCARKGYRLVGANRYGNNLLFVRNGLGETALPDVPLASTRQHPMMRAFDEEAADVRAPMTLVTIP